MQINPFSDSVIQIYFNIILTLMPRPSIAVSLNFRQALMIKEHRTNQTDSGDNTSEIKWWGFGLNIIRYTDFPGWRVFVWFYSDSLLECWYNTYVLSQDIFCDSVFGIATCCGMYGPEIELRIATKFSAPSQTGPVAHPASCTVCKNV